MALFLRTRHARLILGAMVVQALVGLTVARAEIPIPNLRSGQQGAVLLALFVPLVGVAAVLFGLFANKAQIEAVAVRHVNRLDALVVAGAVVVALVVAPLSSLLGSSDGTSLARNFVGLLGIALIIRSTLGLTAAYSAPVLTVAAVALFNSGRLPATDLLEWPIHDSHSLTAWLAAFALLTVGLGCLLVRPVRSE